MVIFGQKTTKEIIDMVASNDSSQETLDLTRSASFQMKSLENTLALAEALKSNTVIKFLILRECDIVDAGVEALGKALAQNTTVEDLNLEQNKLTTRGVIALSQGLASNTSVKTLNLMNQSQKVMGEDALEQFILMFETNLTLTKLMWKVDSRRTWHLSKLITRNVEIGRRLAGGSGIEDLLPTNLRKGSAMAEATLISSVPTPAAASGYAGVATPAAMVQALEMLSEQREVLTSSFEAPQQTIERSLGGQKAAASPPGSPQKPAAAEPEVPRPQVPQLPQEASPKKANKEAEEEAEEAAEEEVEKEEPKQEEVKNEEPKQDKNTKAKKGTPKKSKKKAEEEAEEA